MKQKLWKVLLSLILAIAATATFALPAFAAPADPTPWIFEQPDGQIVTASTLGDEYFMWLETEDGHVIVFNQDTETLYYAYIEDGKLKPGNVPAGQSLRLRSEVLTRDDIQDLIKNVDRSVSSTYLLSPSTLGRLSSSDRISIEQTHNRQPLLVLLLEFADREFCSSYLSTQFPTTTAYWSNHFFGTEGSTVNEWFRESSGDFNLQFTKPVFYEDDGFFIQNPREGVTSIRIQDGVVVVRLEQNHPNAASISGHASSIARPVVSLAFEAVKPFIDLSGVPRTGTHIFNEDFNIYSVFAGYDHGSVGAGALGTPTMSGHVASRLRLTHNFTENRWRNISISDAGLETYGAQGELRRAGSSMTIGLAVHEIGHLLRLPDLYDHTFNSDGVSIYSVMSAGSIGREPGGLPGSSPTHFGAWEKVALGFVEPTVIEVDDISGSQIFDIASHNFSQGQEILKVTSSVNPYQYFLIENRQLAGFDVGLSDPFFAGPQSSSGILIWHISKGAWGTTFSSYGGYYAPHWTRPNNNWMHRGVALEGIGQWQSGVPFFRADGRNAFNAETTPNSNFHEAGFCTYRRAAHNCHPQTVPSNVDIEVLSNTAPVMQVQINGRVCPTVAEGRLPDQIGGEGLRGAPWRLCECGVLTVNEGFINWTATTSPWVAHRLVINEIVFTGSVVAGPSLEGLFAGLWHVTTFEGLEHFDTSNTTNMNRTFADVHRVTDLDLTSWNTSNVTSMSTMFRGVRTITKLDLATWDTSNVTGMGWMFEGMHNLEVLDISTWDTSSVVSMSNMFANTRSLNDPDLTSWNTSNVTNMSSMFRSAIGFTELDLSYWDTSNVVDMSHMFTSTHSLTSLDVSDWDTSSVTSMTSMFNGARALTDLDLSRWDTSSVTNMAHMFSSTHSLVSLNVSNWDTSSAITMSSMFADSRVLTDLDLSNWNTGNVVNMFNMFTRTHALSNLDLSNWDTSRVTDMSWMFCDARSLTSLDLSSWNMYQVVNMDNMFLGASALRVLTVGENFRFGSGFPLVIPTTDFTGFWQNVGSGTVEDPRGIYVLTSIQLVDQFNGATMADTWVWQPVGGYSKPGDICPPISTGRLPDQVGGERFRGAPWVLCACGKLTVGEGFIHQASTSSPWNAHRLTISEIIFTGPITTGTSLGHLFAQLSNVETIEGLEYFDTSKVTNMQAVFHGMRSLTYLDVSSWDTSNVTTMQSMFSGTNSLGTLDVSNWDTGRVTSMAFMFLSAHSLTALDVSNWDTGRVTTMNTMFGGASSLASLDVSGWNTGRVTSMGQMFQSASSLTSLDLSNWDTRNVGQAHMSSMFWGATELSSLTLGENFAFRAGPHLPAVRTTSEFTGFWQNVGDGTPERPRGEHILTSAQLMAQFNGATMADTWVWQPVISE